MSTENEMTGGGGVTSPLARGVRVGAHGLILGLSGVLLWNILSTDGVRLWPDQGFGLLVVGLSVITAAPALIRAILHKHAAFGENLVAGLNGQGRLRLLTFSATWLVFALALPWVGFLLCATAAIAVSMISLARSRVAVAIAVGAIVSLLIFAAFQNVLYVGLPLGPVDLFVINSFLEG